MAARKTGAKKKAPAKKPTRLLSESKVHRILGQMGMDVRDFVERYDKGGRAAGVTEEMAEAVKQFKKDKDLHALMEALGTKNRQTAAMAILRVEEQGRA